MLPKIIWLSFETISVIGNQSIMVQDMPPKQSATSATHVEHVLAFNIHWWVSTVTTRQKMICVYIWGTIDTTYKQTFSKRPMGVRDEVETIWLMCKSSFGKICIDIHYRDGRVRWLLGLNRYMSTFQEPSTQEPTNKHYASVQWVLEISWKLFVSSAKADLARFASISIIKERQYGDSYAKINTWVLFSNQWHNVQIKIIQVSHGYWRQGRNLFTKADKRRSMTNGE